MVKNKQRAGLAAIFQRTTDETQVQPVLDEPTSPVQDAAIPTLPALPPASAEPAATIAQQPITESRLGDIDLDGGRFRSVGIGLRDGEIDALDFIANQAGVKRNAILRYAVRYFLREYALGNVHPELEQQTTVTLRLP